MLVYFWFPFKNGMGDRTRSVWYWTLSPFATCRLDLKPSSLRMLILALIIIVASKSKIHIIKGTLLKIKEHLMQNSRRSAGLMSGNMLHYNDAAKFASPFKRQPQLPINQKTPRVGSNCKCRWRIIAIGVHWYRYSFILVFMIALSILLSSVHANWIQMYVLFIYRFTVPTPLLN